jgi:hypothetical protein
LVRYFGGCFWFLDFIFFLTKWIQRSKYKNNNKISKANSNKKEFLIWIYKKYLLL